MKNIDIINQLKRSGQFAAIDRHFANFMVKLNGSVDPVLGLSAALVCRSTRGGDVCIDLTQIAGGKEEAYSDSSVDLKFPDIESWRNKLQKSSVVGAPGDFTPLILDNKDRLYLHRYWEYENELAQAIQLRINSDNEFIDITKLSHDLANIFPVSQDIDVNWQKVAAAVAAVKKFCVISGGPGTGKTYAVARILALLVKQAQPKKLRIALTAPTGKAAARLVESVQAAQDGLQVGADILASIPGSSSTIHRLLKPIKGTPFFHYNADNPLPVDVVVVDEASMVDLPLMSKLMQALTVNARVILMGDRYQLASVQAGSILGDICGHKQDNGYSHGFVKNLSALVAISEKELQSQKEVVSAIHDNIIYFTHNYRFGAQSGINRLSEAVNAGNADGVIDILKRNQYPQITWYPIDALGDQQAFLDQQIQTHYGRLTGIMDPGEGIDALNRFRILCAVNRGPLGVDRINQQAMQILQNGKPPESVDDFQEWYHGRPILITANDYELGLFNGDVGIAFTAKAATNSLQVYFAEGSSENIRSFYPGRLSHYQSVYAMTIHKSQGSEFDNILLVLPELDNPLFTRELLYTGITRAKRNLSILATESVIRSAVSRRIERTSGLLEALWS